MEAVANLKAVRRKCTWDKSIDLTEEWRSLKVTGDVTTREKLIEFYLPFTQMIAAKIYGRRNYDELEFADYFQHASVGLIEAIDRFDVTRGIKFETFAASRITGAIFNGIETLSEQREQIGARKRIVGDRINSIKREPSGENDAAGLFAHLAEIAVGLAVGFMLEGSNMYQATAAAYNDSTYLRVEQLQLQMRLRNLIDTLPLNEKKIISFHYFQNLSFKEIAVVLDVSDSRISQIHKTALTRLLKVAQTEFRLDLLF